MKFLLRRDLIYVAPTTVSYGSNQTITFKHLPAKMVVNVKAGKGVTQADVQSATVTVLNQTLTSGTVAADWSVAQQTSGNNTITPKVLGTPAVDYHQSVEAIVVPQIIAKGSRLLQITIGAGHFYYIPTAEQSLAAGNQYTYHITVNATGLSVTTQISDWINTKVTGEAEMAEPKNPEDAAIGDFYMSDGTIWDKDEYLTNEQKAACVGIVFWKGDPTNTTNGDPLLKRDFSACTHGLVVALHEARLSSTGVAAKMKWSNSAEQVNAWTNHLDRGENKVNITEQNKLQGYANTVALKAYNNESTNVQSNANLQVLPIAAMEQYQIDYPAPANSSGWYVPSFLELKQVCWGQGSSQSTAGRDLLNGQFAKVDGTKFDGLGNYWSSSEFEDRIYFALGIFFKNGSINFNYKYTNSDESWVRALFAF